MTAHPGGARAQTYDVLIVGAGFGGLAMLHKARQLGLRALVLERAGEVGGVWTWNRYPGARCDVESMQYSYSFDEALQQEWRWSERFAAQPEILAYAAHVAQRFELMPHIRLNTQSRVMVGIPVVVRARPAACLPGPLAKMPTL